MELAGKEIDRARRHDKQISLLLLDADHFKHINDKYGHAAGDAVLKALLERWTNSLRSHDLIGRIGGEEFCILLPEVDIDRAVRTADRLRREISELPFAFDGHLLRVTVSIGVATLVAGDDLPALLRRADQALYRAKEAGRDGVIASAA